MTIYVGGLRARLIRESTYQAVYDALETIGWFDSGRRHSPISFLPTGVDDSENVALNTAALADWDITEEEDEMGSLMSEHRQVYYVDFYAEDDAVGMDFSTDVKDILAGRMPSIGRGAPRIEVYDYTQATPPVIFTVGVENVAIDRPSVFERPWQRYFRTVRFELVDTYGRDDDE